MSSIFYGQGYQPVHGNHSMRQTHQSHKATKLRLLEIVEFPIKSITSATAGLLPLVTSVLMQCKGVVMQLEAKEENDALRARESPPSRYRRPNVLDVRHQRLVGWVTVIL